MGAVLQICYSFHWILNFGYWTFLNSRINLFFHMFRYLLKFSKLVYLLKQNKELFDSLLNRIRSYLIVYVWKLQCVHPLWACFHCLFTGFLLFHMLGYVLSYSGYFSSKTVCRNNSKFRMMTFSSREGFCLLMPRLWGNSHFRITLIQF